MREIIGLFTDKDTREELGLAQIRDALGDGLFPGTSTLHTRARYFLFIPWIYAKVSASNGSLEDARREELRLIEALKQSSPDETGIIGVNAGKTLKSVASTMYWSALSSYGILTSKNLNREQAIAQHGKPITLGLTETDWDTFEVWRSTIPHSPHGPKNFPDEVPEGMNLTFEEASWLQDRFLDSVPDTLLAHLVLHPPHGRSRMPWEDASVLTVQGEAKRILHHAQQFSETMHGAQLLYNLLIAESYEVEKLTQVLDPVETYTALLQEWAERMIHTRPFESWDLDTFFMKITMIRGGRSVTARSERFVREWVDIVREADLSSFGQNDRARILVQNQERDNKGKMARIGNRARLETWGGRSGAGQYTFRWDQVQQILKDLHAGLQRTDEAETVVMIRA